MKINPSFSLFIILLAVFCFSSKISHSQNNEKPSIRFSVAYLSGQNKPHRVVIENLTFPYRGVELKASWQSLGKQPWQVAYRYPAYGVGFNWSTFKTDILGAPASLFFFTNFPQVTTSWAQLDLEVDVGMSYGINPYHPEKNPENFSTGSSFNAFVSFHLEQSFNLGKHLDIFTSQGITHYSNGAIGYPNLGLNIIPSLKFGMRYQPNYVEIIKLKEKLEFDPNWQLNIYVGGGRKMLSNPNNTYHEVLISPAIYYRIGYKRRVGIAYDISYNEAITGVWTRRDETGKELILQAALVSHEFLINKFTILTQVGFYVHNLPFDKVRYNRFDIDCTISRLGIGYYITPWSRAVLNLKAHYIKAEYVEVGLVFDLNFK